jgi:two-component system response regulator FlrC
MKEAEKIIFVVEDDDELRDAITDTLTEQGYSVLGYANGIDALSAIDGKNRPALIISDVHMTPINGHDFMVSVLKKHREIPVILITAYGTVESAVVAMKNGARDYLTKPFESSVLVEMVERHINRYSDLGECGLIASDESMLSLINLARKVAKTDATLLVSGESGTGKEVLSRFIHEHSGRNNGPFVAINCAAIPDNMLEATLFGYEKGAFTSAYQSCPGKFELANDGTILLDEITEMDLSLQAKLLRVLQEREVERLGGKKPIRLNVRVIATTNRDMKGEVDRGNFREDLYYRLNVFPLKIPSLRERRQDICAIATSLIHKWARHNQCKVSRMSVNAKKVLESYAWPGNVRELENVIQRAVILCEGEEIDTDNLFFDNDIYSNEGIADITDADSTINIKDNEYKLIADVLESVDWSRKKASRQLGISERTLRYKLSKMRDSGYAIKAS